MIEFIEAVTRFVQSPGFRVTLIVCGIALFIFLLFRLYLRLRTNNLVNIEYERHFAVEGVYEGEEVELAYDEYFDAMGDDNHNVYEGTIALERI